jgi:hypothetical protein
MAANLATMTWHDRLTGSHRLTPGTQQRDTLRRYATHCVAASQDVCRSGKSRIQSSGELQSRPEHVGLRHNTIPELWQTLFMPGGGHDGARSNDGQGQDCGRIG